MPDVYRSLADRTFESHYSWEEIDIDAPVSVVFEHARRIGDWMTGHVLEPVAGELGEVGHFERVYPRKLEPDTPEPHHHVYGIAYLIPDRYIAIEVMPELGGSYGKDRDWISYDGILLTELDANRTRVAFQQIHYLAGPGTPASHAETEEEIETTRTSLIVPYLRTLKSQAESAVAASSAATAP